MMTPKDVAEYVRMMRRLGVERARFGEVELHLGPEPVRVRAPKRGTGKTEGLTDEDERFAFAHTEGVPVDLPKRAS